MKERKKKNAGSYTERVSLEENGNIILLSICGVFSPLNWCSNSV